MAKLPHGMLGQDDLSLPAPQGDEKIAQSAANYMGESPDETVRCQLCKYFVEPGTCQVVKGVIDPLGTCDLFVAMNDNEGAMPEAMPLQAPPEGGEVGV